MKVNDDIQEIKSPLIIFYGENEGEWLSYWIKQSDRIYSDVFYNDEVKRTFTSLAFISENPNEINYVASFRRSKIVATNKVRVLFDIVIKLSIPLTIDFINKHINKSMENSIKNIFNNKETIQYLNENQLKAIVFSLSQIDEDYVSYIKRILHRDRKLSYNDNRGYITSTERDALGIVLRINDFDEEINNMVNWNIEEMSTPDYLKGLSTVRTREDQLIMKDMRCFGDWRVISEYMPSTCVLSNGKKCVSIMYANRDIVENNTGVDLIYHDHLDKTFVFVQYKRLSERDKKNIYYPASDKNLEKEITLMENFEAKLTKDQTDYRINDQVFYFKFCNERQEVYTKELSSGFYLPKDYFLLINRLQKEECGHINISYDTVTRYLTNTVFIDLIKYGLIGTRVNDADLVSYIIRDILSNRKSLILATSTSLR